MFFNSLSFLIFFPLVVLIYFIIPRKVRYIWLLIASYYFYMSWNAKYAVLLLGSTVVTYLCGIMLSRCKKDDPKSGKNKKLIVALSLVINFAILFVFKYFGFGWSVLASVLGKAGISIGESPLSLLLPVGISFYIFQAVGYTIDVYRGEIDAEKNFFRYALFVSFFPQLVAGPIERSKNLLGRLRDIDKIDLWNINRIREGIVVMVYGYFLKMIIADRAGIYVDRIYAVDSYSLNKGFTVILGILLFSLQIYCDFAGYTFIAIGAGKVMGIDLMTNFKMPYFAVSVKDFWNRWHISLSSWFKDYLYIPLGGSRKGKVRKYLNLMIVFLVSGLWHGAGWHFIVWGGMHGVLRVLEEMTQGIRDKACKMLRIDRKKSSNVFWCMLITFILVSIAWVFFRAESLRQAMDILKQSVAWNPWVLTDGSLFEFGLTQWDFNVLIAALAVLVTVDILRYRGHSLAGWYSKQGLVFRWLFLGIAIMAIILAGVYGAGYNAAQFIYFQF